MCLKEGLCFFLSFYILSASNTPQLESRVYNKDFSIALRGVRVTKSSWESNRLQPTVENSNVACASTCVDKFREDNCCYDGTLLILDTFYRCARTSFRDSDFTRPSVCPSRNNFSWVHRWAVTLPSGLRYPSNHIFSESWWCQLSKFGRKYKYKDKYRDKYKYRDK